MKRLFAISALVIAPMVGFSAFGLAHQAQGERVPIRSQYQNKVIYDVAGTANAQPLENDCRKRGGTFFSAACSECMARCEFQADERLIVPGWEVYEDRQIGVTFNYPHDMQVRKVKPLEAVLALHGANQSAMTPLTDGIEIRIRRESYPPVLTFDEFVQDQIANAQSGGKRVLSATSVTIGRLSGESYRTSDGHEVVHQLFPIATNEAIVLEYEIADPADQSYERIVDRVISSLRLNDILALL